MNTLSHWVEAPVAKALGWTLIHFLWEGLSIAALLAAALALAPSAAARLRYALASLAMLAMPAAFGVTLALIWPGHTGATAVVRHAPPAGALLPPALSQAPDIPEQPGPERRVPWVVPFWVVGVFAFQLRTLGGWVAARRLRRVGVCRAPDAWQWRCAALGRRLRLARPVVLLESCFADVPAVLGLLRPVVLVPVGMLAGLPVEQVESILIHELAHIRRHDYLVNLLQSFLEGLLFYHPAVWWVSGVIRLERENCCDDVVVAVSGDARGYAAALAALEENRWPVPEPALAATGGNLMKRIRRLLKPPEAPRPTPAPVFMAGILLVSAVVALAAWQAPPKLMQLAQQTAPPRPFQQEAETPYRRWLNEDVAYIVTNDEKAAFNRLETDQERERFIEQFWLRRDPTPGTVQNEFKEEHYRRIAYANSNFASNEVAGWKTDRGRIYITYGPPDEKDLHPAGGTYQRPAEQGGGTTSVFPFERWRYRYIEGIGTDIVVEFVDPALSGDYPMTMDPSAKERVPGAAPAVAISDKLFFVGASGTGLATVTVPLDAVSDQRPVNVYGTIITQGGRIVTRFEQSGLEDAVFRKSVPLAPGSYSIAVTVTAKGVAVMILNKTFEVK